MYKHVAKQRKLAENNKQVALSDEDSSGNSESESEASSNSESGSDSEGSEGEGDEFDEAMEELEIETEKEEELLPPPAGFPTALEATKNSIVDSTLVGVEGALENSMICVICPEKALKKGRMLEVHIAGKAHLRRATRFNSHVLSENFPSTSLILDARSISSQLDNLVLGRLTEQTLHGGPSIKPTTSASTPKKSVTKEKRELNALDLIKNQQTKERSSKRAEARAVRAQKNKEKKVAKKEKKARLREAKIEREVKGEVWTKEDTRSIMKPKRNGAPLPSKQQKPKPTPEEIAERQAKKEEQRLNATNENNDTVETGLGKKVKKGKARKPKVLGKSGPSKADRSGGSGKGKKLIGGGRKKSVAAAPAFVLGL